MSTRINLLDWRLARREKRKKQFIAMMGGGAALAAVIVGIGWLYMTNAVANQQERNAYLRTQISEMDQKIKEIQELEKVKANLLARMRVIEELQASRAATVHFFDEILNTLPDGISLTTIKQAGNVVTIQGIAESNGRISTYLKNLEDSMWFDEPRLVVIKTDEKERLRKAEFTLVVKSLKKPGDKKKPGQVDDDGAAQ
jgi:type IV pilus assembly protein PilN